MKIAVAKEVDPSEPRVAASPDTVKKFKALGAEVAIEPGAGIKSGLLDSDFTAAGATVSADALKDADIIIKVKRRPAARTDQLPWRRQSSWGLRRRGKLAGVIPARLANPAPAWQPVTGELSLKLRREKAAQKAGNQTRKIAIRTRITMTAAEPYFTSLMKPS